MPIAVLADFHLGLNLGVDDKSRLREIHRRVIEELFRSASERADALVLAGDVFDKNNPSTDEALFIAGLIKEYFGDKEVLYVTGNHDAPSIMSGKPSIAKLLELRENVRVFDTTDVKRLGVIEFAGYRVLPLPYPMAHGRTLEAVKRRYLQLIYNEDYDYLAGHFTAEGYEEYGGSISFPVRGFGLLGHIHKYLETEKFVYPGSPIAYPFYAFRALHGERSPEAFFFPLVEGRRVERISYRGLHVALYRLRDKGGLKDFLGFLDSLDRAIVRLYVGRKIAESELREMLSLARRRGEFVFVIKREEPKRLEIKELLGVTDEESADVVTEAIKRIAGRDERARKLLMKLYELSQSGEISEEDLKALVEEYMGGPI